MDSSVLMKSSNFSESSPEIHALDNHLATLGLSYLPWLLEMLQFVQVKDFLPSVIHAGWTLFPDTRFSNQFQLYSSHLPIHPCSIAYN